MDATEKPVPVYHILTLERTDTGWTDKSREYFTEVVKRLGAGAYEIQIKSKSTAYRSTRYKYYFAHVLTVILITCAKHFQIFNEIVNEFEPVTNTAQIHEALKLKYNPVMVKTPYGLFTVPASTTGMSDTDFINRFEEMIIAEFAGSPFYCEFMTRQEYGQFMSGK